MESNLWDAGDRVQKKKTSGKNPGPRKKRDLLKDSTVSFLGCIVGTQNPQGTINSLGYLANLLRI